MHAWFDVDIVALLCNLQLGLTSAFPQHSTMPQHFTTTNFGHPPHQSHIRFVIYSTQCWLDHAIQPMASINTYENCKWKLLLMCHINFVPNCPYMSPSSLSSIYPWTLFLCSCVTIMYCNPFGLICSIYDAALRDELGLGFRVEGCLMALRWDGSWNL